MLGCVINIKHKLGELHKKNRMSHDNRFSKTNYLKTNLLKQIKKIYGEDTMHLCRNLFPSILEHEGLLLSILKEHFAPTKFLAQEIISQHQEENFKNFIFGFIDVENDILKIACVERHKNTNHIGVGYVKGYSLKSGAVATSIAHDSHNIITVGCSDSDIAIAVNAIKDNNGGITGITYCRFNVGRTIKSS